MNHSFTSIHFSYRSSIATACQNPLLAFLFAAPAAHTTRTILKRLFEMQRRRPLPSSPLTSRYKDYSCSARVSPAQILICRIPLLLALSPCSTSSSRSIRNHRSSTRAWSIPTGRLQSFNHLASTIPATFLRTLSWRSHIFHGLSSCIAACKISTAAFKMTSELSPER